MESSGGWKEAYDRYVTLLQGRTPFTDGERNEVERAWNVNAAAVDEIVEKASASYAAGTVRYPWAWIAAATRDKPKRVERKESPLLRLDVAEQHAAAWMRSAGAHFDRWSEVEDELFGERGMLRHWRLSDDVKLRTRRWWTEARALMTQTEGTE